MSLLAILAARPLSFATCLRSTATNLALLSRGHRDAWGAATYATDGLWSMERREGSAAAHELLGDPNTPDGVALITHVHVRTVGAATPKATSPFRRGRWVFAHAGVVDDLPFVKSRTSRERRLQCEAEVDNDSELLFAFLLTRLDERNAADRIAPDQVDMAMTAAALELASCRVGSSTFVLSDGNTLYAHRFGRALYVVQRWRANPKILVASEPLTGHEAWSPLADGSLVRYRRSSGSRVDAQSLAGPIAEESVPDIELPFTD